jgi:hypothetical protein
MTSSDEPTPGRPDTPAEGPQNAPNTPRADNAEYAEYAETAEAPAAADTRESAATPSDAEPVSEPVSEPVPPPGSQPMAQPGYAAYVPAGYGVYPVPAPKTRFWSRMLSMRAVAAVALAGLILGGAGGTVVGLVAGHDDHGRVDRERFGPVLQFQPDQQGQSDQGQQGQGFPGQPPGLPDQVPPSTPPEDGTG